MKRKKRKVRFTVAKDRKPTPVRCWAMRADGGRCGWRATLSKQPHEYAKPPKCKRCGRVITVIDFWRVKKEWKAKPCNCYGYAFPHARGRGFCEHNKKLTAEDLRIREEDRSVKQIKMPFLFDLDGGQPICNLSSGWMRLKQKLVKVTDPDGLSELDRLVLREAYRACARRKAMTGYRWDVDHLIPVARGGRHRYDNFQVIPRWMNLWKGDSMVLTKVAEFAMLLPGGGPDLFDAGVNHD